MRAGGEWTGLRGGDWLLVPPVLGIFHLRRPWASHARGGRLIAALLCVLGSGHRSPCKDRPAKSGLERGRSGWHWWVWGTKERCRALSISAAPRLPRGLDVNESMFYELSRQDGVCLLVALGMDEAGGWGSLWGSLPRLPGSECRPVSAVGRCGEACLARRWEPRSRSSSFCVADFKARELFTTSRGRSVAFPAHDSCTAQRGIQAKPRLTTWPGAGGLCLWGVRSPGWVLDPGVGEARKQAGVGQSAVWALGRGPTAARARRE